MDFGDGWEHVDDPNNPESASMGGAVAMGVNIVAYALTQARSRPAMTVRPAKPPACAEGFVQSVKSVPIG
jgi:hypothetical protein